MGITQPSSRRLQNGLQISNPFPLQLILKGFDRLRFLTEVNGILVNFFSEAKTKQEGPNTG